MTEEQTIERIARAAHNTLVTYCRLSGDYSIKEWDDALDWQRKDTIAMVKATLQGEGGAKAEHDRWLSAKLAKGYVYGAEKNDDATKGPLTNPNVLEYHQLPLYQRMKDILLPVVVIGMAGHYGLTVKKVPDLVYV